MIARPDSQAVTDIHAPHLYEGVGLPMWVLYDHPADLPGHFVLRMWDGMRNTPTPYVFLSRTLAGIREQVETGPRGFHKLERFENDDPKIMAVWL